MKMKKLLKSFSLLIMLGFAVLVLWMNLTPGHFLYDKTQCCSCGGRVSYLSESKNVRPPECNVVLCAQVICSTLVSKLINNSKLLLAKIDFNK